MRTGQTAHVETLRAICAAGSADYTFNGDTFWTDDQLGDILDDHSRYVRGVKLTPVPHNDGGTFYYYHYVYGLNNVEDDTSGTAYFRLYDDQGNTIGTADYTHDPSTQEVVFSSDRGGSVVLMDVLQYNINKAAASVWRRKAAVITEHSYDVHFDGHKLSRHQRLDMYLSAAAYYERAGGFDSVPLIRSDISGG